MTPQRVAALDLELISVHFPKAAGTSLAGLLREIYGNALHLDYDHPPHDPREGEPIDRYPIIRAVHGHFHAGRYDAFPSARRVTFLREPVDNLISIYFFWQAMAACGYPAHDRLLNEQPDIVEFSTYPEVRTLASASYFGGVDLRSFDLVGFYETRSVSIARLSNLLGAKLDCSIRLNTTEFGGDSRREILATPSIMTTLRANLSDDIAFYEEARTHWD